MDRFARFNTPIVRCSLVALFSLIPTQLTFATSNGIGGYSGETVNCATSCHTNVATLPTVTLTGPMTVTPNKPSTYTLVITGGPATAAGMDVSVGGGGGLLTATMTGTKKTGRDIVHSAPTALTAGSATYTFLWTAPSSNGTFIIYAAGMSSNGSGAGGDGTVTTTLSVSVAGVADPADPPITPDGTGGTGTMGTGEALFNSMCSGCHSTGGTGGSIVGETAADILDAFATIPDHATVAAALTPVQIDDIAAFLNGAGPVSAGEALFNTNCAACHGPDGAGGSIVGESAADILEAFAEYPVHAGVAAALSAEQIDAIAAFLSEEEVEEDFGTGSGATTKGTGHASAAKVSAAGSFDLLSLVGAGLLAAGVGRRRKK